MKKSNVKPQAENHFIKEWNETEFNLSIPAKITHSNKPFIYFYWHNPANYAKLERARKGGIGGVNDTRISIKKKAVAAVDAPILILSKGWNPFTNAYVNLGVQVNLHSASQISKCLETWVEHREERHQSNMIGKTALKNNKIAVKHFMDWLDAKGFLSRKIETFNAIDIDNFLGFKMNQLGWGKVTYNSYRCDLCTFFSFLCKYKIIRENPCMGNVNIGIWGDMHLEEFMASWERYFFGSTFSHLLGESSPVKQDIKQQPDRIKIRMLKTEKLLTIPLSTNAKQILEKYIKLTDDRDNYAALPRMTNQVINRQLKSLMEKAKIEKHISFHCARHSFASNLIENGVNITSVKELLGHQNISETQIYARSLSAELFSSVNNLDDGYH